MTKKIFCRSMLLTLLAVVLCAVPAGAQRTLSLDSCRALAVENNKQLKVARLKQEVALNTRKAARTKYLPKVDVMGGYEYTNREVSILNNDQKYALSNAGSMLAGNVGGRVGQALTDMVAQGLISPQTAQYLGTVLSELGGHLGQAGDAVGRDIVNAFRTDTRNMWAGAVMLRQPVFMGGAITAANRMADIGEELAGNQYELQAQNTRYTIDQTYWLVVSLQQKQQLARKYLELVTKLDSDVHKMIDEGVATRADGLKVDVKKNEAELTLTQADDGVALAKMLLCQLCGLPLEEDIVLTSTPQHDGGVVEQVQPDGNLAQNRPELRMLQNALDLSLQATKLVRAEYLPHIALTGGYLVSNPNVYNGFQRRFAGTWNVGVLVQMPLWNWFESSYKVRSSKAASAIAQTELYDAQEKINLQVQQCRFKLKEARKRYAMAQQNMSSAEENLRCANVGFREGVMDSTDVMAAQTAWQSAHSMKIDAEVEVAMAQLELEKSLGTLTF